MPLSRIVNNVGIGKEENTYVNLTTTVSGKTQFTQPMVDAYARAASLASNYEIYAATTTYAPLHGSVLAVSENVRSALKNYPEKVVLQVDGVALMQGTTTRATANVAVLTSAGLSGFIRNASGHATTFRLHRHRGMVVNVWDTDRVDVDLNIG